MSQKIPKEKLRDLYERSVNGLLDASQCAIWLPDVCAMALDLLREAEARERAMAMARRVEDFRKRREG
jgi:hypothetical protein